MTKEQQVIQLLDELSKVYIYFDIRRDKIIKKEDFEDVVFGSLLTTTQKIDTLEDAKIFIHWISDIKLLEKSKLREML